MKRLMLSVSLMLSVAGVAIGKTCTWSGNGTGWSDPNNWDEAPGSGDTVVIPAGKTATATEADMALVCALGEIQLAADSSGLTFSGLTTARTFAVPLSGGGMFKVVDGTLGQYLTLAGDNTAFTGPFDFNNAQVKVGSVTALGLANSVTCAAGTLANEANRALVYVVDGTFGNDLVFSGARCAKIAANVTNTGSLTISGYTAVIVTESHTFTQTGDFTQTSGSYGAYLGGDGAFNFPGPGAFCANAACKTPLQPWTTAKAQIRLGTPFAAPVGFILSMSAAGIMVFDAADLVGGDYDIRFGAESFGVNYCYAKYDLNGFDQSCRDLLVFNQSYSVAAAKNAVVRSDRPAKLTVKGKGVGGGASNADPLYFQLNGQASLELDSATTEPGSLRLGGTSDTTGGLFARRGTIRLEEGSSFARLSQLVVSDTGVIEVDTDEFGSPNMEISGSGVVKLEKDIAVRTLKVDGQYVSADTYAGGAATFGGRLQGTGRLTVLISSPDPNPGHAAETLAFYPFDDTPAGRPFGPVRNDANTRFTGTASAGSEASVKADAEAPGRYVFARKRLGEPVLYENPQSIRLSGAAGMISFEALSTALSSNADYTIEFFFKQSASHASDYYRGLLNWDVGTIYHGKAAAAQDGLPHAMKVVACSDTRWYISTTATCTDFAIGCNWTPTTITPTDGLWHHMAVTYSTNTQAVVLYRDYARYSSSIANVTNTVFSDSRPFSIGNELANGFNGLVSCVRVSAKCLEADDFLRVAATSNVVDETVFHLSLDGTPGETPATFPSRTHTVAENYPGQAWAKNMTCAGTPVTWTTAGGSVVAPTIVADVPRRSWPHLNSGTNTLCIDEGAAYFACKTRTTEAYCVNGCGVDVLPAAYDPAESGSFTLEGFFRFDHETWKERIVDAGTNPECQRLTFFGINNSQKNHEFVLLSVYKYGGFDLEMWFGSPNVKPTGSIYASTLPANFLKDGKWHHYAIVYDDTAMTFAVYYDYQRKMLKQLSEPYRLAAPLDDCTCKIGYGLNNSAFCGNIDEVRLVRRALKPEEFLNFRTLPGEGPGAVLIVR